MARRSPADAEARREYIVSYGLVPGVRVRDTAFEVPPKFARVLGHTAAYMTRIEYESADDQKLHGAALLVNPTRLRPAPKAAS